VWLGAAFLLASVRTSMTRHVLVPAGRVRVVFVSVTAGAVVGVPLIALLTWALGPVGGALGLLVSEAVATGVLVHPTRQRLEDLRGATGAAGTRIDDGVVGQ